jgi:hypothetical protein
MGVCFMASGLQGLQFVGPEESRRLHDNSIRVLFLRIGTESVATFAIGTILTLSASLFHGWLVRDRSRNVDGSEAR